MPSVVCACQASLRTLANHWNPSPLSTRAPLNHRYQETLAITNGGYGMDPAYGMQPGMPQPGMPGMPGMPPMPPQGMPGSYPMPPQGMPGMY